MNKTTLDYVRELISYLEEYLQQPEARVNDTEDWVIPFARWMQQAAGTDQEDSEHNGMEMTEILIGMYLSNLANLLKKAQNRFVSETPFAAFMDFQFLFVLSEHQEMTKSQLIAANLLEMSSGIEVINRLKRSGWIQEEPNPDDRRSKIIQVSQEGSRVLSDYRQQGLAIYTSYSASLSDADKPSVLASLQLIGDVNR